MILESAKSWGVVIEIIDFKVIGKNSLKICINQSPQYLAISVIYFLLSDVVWTNSALHGDTFESHFRKGVIFFTNYLPSFCIIDKKLYWNEVMFEYCIKPSKVWYPSCKVVQPVMCIWSHIFFVGLFYYSVQRKKACSIIYFLFSSLFRAHPFA